MTTAAQILFPPFHLDLANEHLLQDTHIIPLKPKTFAILRYLVENPGRLVTKEELLKVIWGQVRVSEAILRGYIRELRQALADDPREPRFIETVHGRGYRFIGPVSGGQKELSSTPQPTAESLRPPTAMVGRETELAQLHAWLEKTRQGERQLVFVTGEPGIGKTTVVEAFLEQAGPASSLWTAHGQCLEHYGAGEAYLPMLEVLGRLCQQLADQPLIALLHRYAPSWLAQMPWLLNSEEREELRQQVMGTTQARMLRELAQAVEALTVQRPLVLVLEDLQWSDYATLDLIRYLAQRPEPARLFMIGTYRTGNVQGNEHPLHTVKQELQVHGHSTELSLTLLSPKAVGDYLAARFTSAPQLPLGALARFIHRRTEGNPLFMVNMVDDLVSHGRISRSDGQWVLPGELEEMEPEVPENLRQMIEKRAERLSPEEQRILETASVTGTEFTAAAVAAGLGKETLAVEEACTQLIRHEQFIQTRGVGEWPDGTVSTRYGFIHALYQEVLYGRVPAGKRSSLHQRIGDREEQGYGGRAQEVAAELAMHFERGKDYRRAIQYRQHAANNAIQRSAYQEAMAHLTQGSKLLRALPDTSERTRQEIMLSVALCEPLFALKGESAPEVEQVSTRAWELCQQLEDPPLRAGVLLNLWGVHLIQGKLQSARELAEQATSLAERARDPKLFLGARYALGITLFYLGNMTRARTHLEQGIILYNSHPGHYSVINPEVGCLSHLAQILGYGGYPEQALKKIEEALIIAQDLSQPYSLAFTLFHAALIHWLRRETQAARERAEAAIALSEEYGFPLYLAGGNILRGWALAQQGQGEEGITQIRRAIDASQSLGAGLLQLVFPAIMAEACAKVGRMEEGLRAWDGAADAMDHSGEHFLEAEIHRLKGELLLGQEDKSGSHAAIYRPEQKSVLSIVERAKGKNKHETEAERCFQQALKVARGQEAKLLELRAATSLSRLWHQQDKKTEARELLAETYGWFNEGFDTRDLKEAKILLAELS